MAEDTISDLLVILVAGMLAGLIGRRIGVSTLVGYLLAGALIGSGMLGWIGDEHHEVEYLAEAGVLFLLFSIGMEFSLDRLAKFAGYILLGGVVQMVAVTVPTALVMYLGTGVWQKGVFWGLAVTMSSTVLVFKALAEYGRTTHPNGIRSMSVLLFQDVAIVPILLIIPILTGEVSENLTLEYAALAGTTIALVLGVLALRWTLDHWAVPFLAGLRSPELLTLFAIVVLGVVTLITYKAGLPPPLGAFAAGLAMGGNRLTGQVDALILPFREAFAAVFFVSLGLLFEPSLLASEPLLLLGAFVGVVSLKTLGGALAARVTGLGWRSSFGVGLGLSQIGEFAFVLAFTGWEAGLLREIDYQRILILALGSLVITPRLLKIGMRWSESTESQAAGAKGAGAALVPARHAVVIGAGPVGQRVTERLAGSGCDVCVVDLSPVNLHRLAQAGHRTVAGDARDSHVLTRARAADAQLIVVAVPDDSIARQVVVHVRRANATAFVMVRCRYLSKLPGLHKAGANAVVSEEAESSEALLRQLTELWPDVTQPSDQ